jgi:gluconate 2-dehydrogenase gamma chain
MQTTSGRGLSGLGPGRRELLATTAMWLLFSTNSARALVVEGSLPWAPNAGSPPTAVRPGPWVYFTPEEGHAVEALVDRLIPPDPHTPGGKDAGCAVFIDRQLVGPYGSAQGLYTRGPFTEGTPEQGLQSPVTPAERYRQSLAALDKYCRATYAGTPFGRLSDDDKDKVISGLEQGTITLDGANGRVFFEQLLTNTQEGFFADPVYGGNRDMVGWKMIGFPGARYDYRDWVDRHNERYPRPPVGITGRPEWVAKPT